ncbi:MAG: hypothetical protein ISS47_01755 [Candidatus Omnitrophica bacterium]|nr:hypothetical protein [Candidatus Omnitrophota bacterium]
MQIEIGGICIGWQIDSLEILKRVKQYYIHYLVKKSPQIIIKVNYGNSPISGIKKIIYRTKDWILFKAKDYLVFGFPDLPDKVSLALISASFREIEFLTKDLNSQVLLYLFPALLLNLILPKNNGLILHACGIVDKKRGYLFVAQSEGGKSTIAKLALKRGFTVLNDDWIIIRKINKEFMIYDTPWHRTRQKVHNRSFPITEIFFLNKNSYNYLEPLKKSEAVKTLLKNSSYLPISNDLTKRSFNFNTDLAKNLKCYQFNFKPNQSIWKMEVFR